MEAEKQKNWLTWLSDITHLGYKEDPYIIVSTKDAKLIEKYYKDGKTPEEALELYKKYRNYQPQKNKS